MKITRYVFIFKRQILLLVVDFLIIALAVAVFLSRKVVGLSALWVIVVPLPYLFVFYIFDLYSLNRNYRKSREIVRLGCVVALGFIFSSFIFLFAPILYRMVNFLFFFTILFTIMAWRFFYSYVFNTRSIVKRCLIVGTGKAGMETFSLIRSNPYCGFQVVGFVDSLTKKSTPAGSETCPKWERDIDIVGDLSEIEDIVKTYNIKTVVVSLEKDRLKEFYSHLIAISEEGVEITTSTDVFAQIVNRIPLSHIDAGWVYLMLINKFNYYCSPLKRALDVIGAIVGIVLSIPLYIVVPVLIKTTSKGPVFFLQERIGLHHKVFKTYKFRTMFDNAEEKNCSTVDNDSRVTPVGKFLRRTKIDEWPQFINVLKGEMSLVGPRPVSVKESEERSYEKTIPFWNLRFHVNPGISGWAQVNYPYGATIEEATRRMEYEIFYIKNNSFILDLLVIAKTIKAILHMPGR